MSYEELKRLESLLTLKLEKLSSEQNVQNDELVLTASILKFVQTLVQREVRKIDDEKFWISPSSPIFSQSISAPPAIYKMVANATICTNCREKHPNMTHCVHVMSDCLSDSFESQSSSRVIVNSVSLKHNESVTTNDSSAQIDIDKFVVKS